MKKTFEEHKKLILEFMRDGLYVPMKEKELAIILQTEPEDRAELKAVLNSLPFLRVVTLPPTMFMPSSFARDESRALVRFPSSSAISGEISAGEKPVFQVSGRTTTSGLSLSTVSLISFSARAKL